METAVVLSQFTAGELSPRLWGRVDLERYTQGCRTLTNMQVHPHGGASKRYGTKYVGEVKDSTKAVRLIPFEFSVLQAYVIEVGDQYFRFYKDNGAIEGYTLVTNGTFDSDISGWTDLSTGGGSISHNAGLQRMNLTGDGVGGYGWAEQELTIDTECQGYPHTVTFRVYGGSLEMQIGSSTGSAQVVANATYGIGVHKVAFTPTVGSVFLQFRNGAAATYTLDNVDCYSDQYEISTPYLEADIWDLKFAQDADTMFIVHENYKPRKLTRTDHNQWTLTECDFFNGPYLEEDDSGTTITPSGTTGSITLTASASLFTSDDIGRIMAIKHSTAYGWGLITAVTDATHASMTVKADLDGSGTAAAAWKWGAWGGEQGWPQCVTFYEQRLIIAATPEQPQTVWGSANKGATEQGYENFEIGTNDDDSWEYTLASESVNTILWLVSARFLFIGTHGGEWVMSSGTSDSPITPSQVKVRRETKFGSYGIQAVHMGHTILFVQRSGKKVRQIKYRIDDDTFRAMEVSILAEHFTRGYPIVDWAHQIEPDSILWSIRGDGALLGFTLEDEHKIFAWHYHATYGGTDLFESVTSIPVSTHDQVWFVVRRYIDGSWVRYIEYFASDFGIDQTDCFFVDSGLTHYNYKTPTGISKANPGVVTCDGHDFDNGDKLYFSNIGGMTELNGNYYYVANKTYDTFELNDKDGNNINTSGYTAFTSGGYMTEVSKTFSGLDHLEGRELTLLADGAARSKVTVSGGSITLDRECMKLHAGLSYSAILEPMAIEAMIQKVASMGRTKRISEIAVRLYETVGAKIGSTADDAEIIPFRKADDPMDAPIPLFSGLKELTFPGDWEKDATIHIESDTPLPLTVLALVAKVDIQGD